MTVDRPISEEGALKNRYWMFAVLLACSGINVLSAAEAAAPAEITLKSKLESMKKAGVGSVVYPHKLHETLYQCGDCHPKIFKEKIGANDINMQKNIDGEFCGSSGCHSGVEAFPLLLCEKCHSGKTE